MESSESSTPQKTHTPTKNRTKSHDPRRFTDEQIKSLESIFAQETKLEPTKKMQLARDLSLHPRQVAIWFQNKRARWKSKRIEQEFTQLKSSYDALSIRFDDLKREKQSLQMQLQEVNDRLKNRERDDSRVNDVRIDDDRIITSGFKRTEDQEFLTCGEKMMSQTWRDLSDSGSLLFDESSEINPNWWES